MRIESITSAQNPKIKNLLLLQEKSRVRKEQGLFVVEGRRELEHCVAAGLRVRTLFVCPEIAGPDASVAKVAPCCGTPLTSFAPAPPIVSCVPASQELVSNGPLPLPVSGGGHARSTELPSSATASGPAIIGQMNSVWTRKPAARQCSSSRRPSTTKSPCSFRARDFSWRRSKFLIFGFWADVTISIRLFIICR